MKKLRKELEDCNKMKNAEKWWIWLIASIIFLIVVQILFSIPAPYKWLEAVWEAGNLITFVGTIALGYVAVSQTQRANRMSERLMDIENNRYMLAIRPFIMVTEWKAYDISVGKLLFNPDILYIQIGSYNDGEPSLGIGLQLQNTTDSYVSAEYLRGHSDKVKWSNSATNQPNRKLRLLAGDSQEIVFYANQEYMKSLVDKIITVEFILENRFAERYKESFCLRITVLSNEYIHNDGEWYCDAAVQDFKIGKFEKNSDGQTVLKMEEQTNG